MHLLIIILQQLLGLLPNGEGKKAPQVELARSPRANPKGSDPSALVDSESRRHDWMTSYWKSGPQSLDWANDLVPSAEGRRLSGISAVEWMYAQFKRRLRPAPRTGRPPGAAGPDVGA